MPALRASIAAKVMLMASLVLLPALAAQHSYKLGELKTVDGHEYHDVTVTEKSTEGIAIRYKSGVVRLPWNEVPAETQRLLGYDAAAEAAAQQKAANASEAGPPQLQLTNTAAQYKAELERRLASMPVSSVTDIIAARQFAATAQDLLSSLSNHAQLIVAKWSEVSRQLRGSGLSDWGAERVFLKQFLQEDMRSNVEVLESARRLKDQLLNSRVPGSERVTVAVMSLFSAYASLSERDRTPSADPAGFIRDLRTQYEFFAVAVVVFADQLKAFVDKVPKASPHP